MIARLRTDIGDYVENKKWWLYAPLWLLFASMFWSLTEFNFSNTPLLILPAQSFNFWMHEIMHLVTAGMPPIMTALSGSLSELLLGLLLIIGAFKTSSYFASIVCSLWFMLSCQSVGIYMADAQAQALPLVSLGDGFTGTGTVIHDWNFILSEWGLLSYAEQLGNGLRGFGTLVGLLSLIFGIWLMYKMAVAIPSDGKILLSPAEKAASTYPAPQSGWLAENPADKDKLHTPPKA